MTLRGGQMGDVELSVLIPHFGPIDTTANLVSEVLEIQTVSQVLVYANGSVGELRSALDAVVARRSMDGATTPDWELSPAATLTVLGGEDNLGFGAAVNRLLRAASEQGGEHFVILNNDVSDTALTMCQLATCVTTSPTLATIPQADEAGEVVIGTQLHQRWSFTRHRTRDWGEVAIPSLEPLPEGVLPQGGALYVNWAAISAVGPLREDFFLYFEEVEWALRAKASGVQLALAVVASLRHEQGSTLDSSVESSAHDRQYFMARSRLRFALLTGGWIRFAFAIVTSLSFIARFALALKWKSAWAVAQGGFDSQRPPRASRIPDVGERTHSPAPAVTVVCGASPSQTRCGVEDYSHRLVSSIGGDDGLNAQNLTVNTLIDALRHRSVLRESAVVHLQYPSLGQRSAPLAPFFVGWFGRGRLFVTLHEWSASNSARKLLSAALARMAGSRLIMTTEAEADEFQGSLLARLLGCRVSQIIPIGSNITPASAMPPWEQRCGVVYFGLIAERAELRQMPPVIRQLVAAGIPFYVVGAPRSGSSGLIDSMREAGATMMTNRADQEVSLTLLGVRVAYLPFEDGASLRHGTLLAAVAHGLQVVTTEGPHTPLEGPWRLVGADAADSLLAAHGADSPSVELAADYAWPRIAERHVDYYHEAAQP